MITIETERGGYDTLFRINGYVLRPDNGYRMQLRRDDVWVGLDAQVTRMIQQIFLIPEINEVSVHPGAIFVYAKGMGCWYSGRLIRDIEKIIRDSLETKREVVIHVPRGTHVTIREY